MSDAVKVGFVPFSAAPRGILVVFCDDALKFGAATRKALGTAADIVKRAAAANQFKGKSGSTLDILAPEGIKAERLIVVGAGKPSAIKEKDFLKFGGVTAGKLNAASDAVTVIAELPDGAMQADAGGGDRIGHPAARLQIRPLQDQEEGRRERRPAGRRFDCGRRCRRRAKGLRAGIACRRWRHHRARTRQRAAERTLSRGIRAPREPARASSASMSRCSTSRR